MNLFRQVQLGQSFLHSEEQHINACTLDSGDCMGTGNLG